MTSDVHSEVPDRRPAPRQRARQAAVAERQTAKAVTADIKRRLTRWHLEIARLRGVVEWRRPHTRDASLGVEINALAAEIHFHRTAFIEAVSALPPNLASSGWITDVDRVLCRASEVVEAIRVTDAGLAS